MRLSLWIIDYCKQYTVYKAMRWRGVGEAPSTGVGSLRAYSYDMPRFLPPEEIGSIGGKSFIAYRVGCSAVNINSTVQRKINLNASRPSEHPPVRGENVKTFDTCTV